MSGIRLMLAMALTVVVPTALRAQGGTGAPPEVVKAQAAMQAKDYRTAISLLEEFYRRSPNAIAGRLILGNAYRQSGDLDRAITIFLAITQPRPVRLQARFNAAAIEASRNHPDAAFRLLDELKASGAFDLDLVTGSADFASLASDPRYRRLAFTPADFQRPFVEPVRIIHEWVAEHKGDQFSWIARGIGDVDGDGVTDIVTSAPTVNASGPTSAEGRIYLYSGKSGRLLWTRTGNPGETLGTGLEGAGDVDRDGIPDVVAGAPGANLAYVLAGRTGATLLTLRPTNPNEGFGASAAGVGDQNGDGHGDVLIGAPSSNVAGASAGRVYLFSGKDGAVLATRDGEGAGQAFGSIVAGLKGTSAGRMLVGAPGAGTGSRGRVYVYGSLAEAPRFIVESDSTGVALGAMFTSLVGDVDGDHVPDVFASDFGNAAKGPATGRGYVHSGATGRRLHTFTGEAPGDGFGIGSADVGDVNRDGFDDVLLGAWQVASVAPSGGKVYLFSGKDGSLLRSITGRVPGETLGFDATGVGDVDGDGVVDFLITSSWSNIKGFQSGRMYVISGANP